MKHYAIRVAACSLRSIKQAIANLVKMNAPHRTIVIQMAREQVTPIGIARTGHVNGEQNIDPPFDKRKLS